MNTILNIAFLNILAAVVLTGCDSGTNDMGVTSGTISSSDGKPGAPVSLSYELPAAPALGTAVDVSVTVIIDSPVDKVEISVTDSEGLQLVGTPQLSLGVQKAGARHAMTVSVIPLEGGLRFVNVFAKTQKGVHESRRSFAIPVAGGGDKTLQKTAGTPQVMPDGEEIISLPAEEDGN